MTDLLTERLTLRPMDSHEAVRVLAGEPADDARWAPGYPNEGDVSAAQNTLDLFTRGGDPRPWCAYEVCLREGGEVIGTAGFHGPADAAGMVTVGYGLVPSARGRGYATEALRALLRFAREHGARAAMGEAELDNTASQRVMAKAGMLLVAEDAELRRYETDWTASAVPARTPAEADRA